MLAMLASIRAGTLPPTSLDDSEGTAEYSNGRFSVVLPLPAKWE